MGEGFYVRKNEYGSVFPYMDGIPFLSYEQFADAVSEARKRILDVDKELILPKGKQDFPDGHIFRSVRAVFCVLRIFAV